MNKIEKVLTKFNVPYKKYGDKEGDALEIQFPSSAITLSVFDDELEICTAVERRTNAGMQIGIGEGWITYDTIIEEILECIVNKK